MNKLDTNFYLQDTLEVAKNLLGKYLVREYDGIKIIGIINEVEAYLGNSDKSCHAYNGKRTNRTEMMYNKGGCAYVYFIYGVYYCLNVVTEEEDKAAAVLIRSVAIVNNLDIISNARYNKNYKNLNKNEIKNISNGPGKVCRCLNIDKSLNGKSLLENELYICSSINGFDEILVKDFNKTKRIGLGKNAEESKDFLWRFIY